MHRGPHISLLAAIAACLAGTAGCNVLLPEVSTQPVLHNPFPQLSRVAVAPFFNQSDEATVDGRQFAMAYFAELQDVPGYEVVPVGVVEQTMIRHAVDLSSPGEARRLAQLLGVDAVLVGSVTDFSPYYPPRCGLRVEWYAANPGYHEIPAGYGLPWGTSDEEYIPDDLVFEAEMALAREQLATQAPDCGNLCEPLPAPPAFVNPHQASPIESAMPMELGHAEGSDDHAGDDHESDDQHNAEELPAPSDSDAKEDAGDASDGMKDHSASTSRSKVQQADFEAPALDCPNDSDACGPTTDAAVATATTGASQLPPAGWPDARGFTPPGPSAERPRCVPTLGPVMTHTRIYRGNDPDFTAALASYVSFRDEARFGGWQSYLERSDDFIRFCAHLHLAETLTARGGGGETRVLRRWSESR